MGKKENMMKEFAHAILFLLEVKMDPLAEDVMLEGNDDVDGEMDATLMTQLLARIEALESITSAQSDRIATLEHRLEEAEAHAEVSAVASVAATQKRLSSSSSSAARPQSARQSSASAAHVSRVGRNPTSSSSSKGRNTNGKSTARVPAAAAAAAAATERKLKFKGASERLTNPRPNSSRRRIESAGGVSAAHRYCYLDVTVGAVPKGRMVFELCTDVVPRTCSNFRALCSGELGRSLKSGKKLHYKGNYFHRVIPGFMAQSGDIVNNDGSSGESVFETDTFEDENFAIPHDRAGMLSMANAGPDSNSSQFFVTFAPAPWLDGKNVVFGHLVSGIKTLRAIEAVGTKSSKPKKAVIITACGTLATPPVSKKKKSLLSSSSSSLPSSSFSRVASPASNVSSTTSAVATASSPVSSSSSSSTRSQEHQQPQQHKQHQKQSSFSSSSTASLSSSLISSSLSEAALPRVFLEISREGEVLGRAIIELRVDVVPYTAENFRMLCTGERGFGYKGSTFHRIYPNHAIQGGDITSRDGFGGKSIFSDPRDANDRGLFKDESFELKHSQPGVVSMANSAPNTNTSQFMVMLCADPTNDGSNVAFGQVVQGFFVFHEMNKWATGESSGFVPTATFVISDCGMVIDNDE